MDFVLSIALTVNGEAARNIYFVNAASNGIYVNLTAMIRRFTKVGNRR